MPESLPLNIDPRIYGGSNQPYNTPAQYTSEDATNGMVPPMGKPVESFQAFVGTPQNLEGAANEIYANRTTATAGESLKASTKGWMTTKAYEALNAPKNATVQGYNATPLLDTLPFAADEEQRKYVLGANNPENGAWRQQQLIDHHHAEQIAGDNPKVALFTSLVDPGYFVIDALSMGAGRIAKLAQVGIKGQKLATSASAIASTYAFGKTAQQAAPLSETEVVIGALLMGAVSGAMYKDGVLHKIDPAFPDKELHEVAVEAGTPGHEWKTQLDEHGKPKVDLAGSPVVERVPTPEHLDSITAKALDSEVEAMPPKLNKQMPLSDYPTAHIEPPTIGKSGIERPSLSGRSVLEGIMQDTTQPIAQGYATHLLSKLSKLVDDVQVYVLPKTELLKQNAGREFYSMDKHAIFVTAETGPFTKLHEMTHALTAHKIEYGLANPTSTHGKLVAQLEAIRVRAETLSKQLPKGEHSSTVAQYFSKNVDEFTAGLFSNHAEFNKLLSEMPAIGGGNLLSKFVDTIRELLGFPASERNAFLHAMNISNKLMDAKLNVTLTDTTERGLSKSFRLAPPEGNPVQIRKTIVDRVETEAMKTGNKVSWSFFKSGAKYNETTKRIFDTLFDNPVDMRGDSVISQKMAVRADLGRIQAEVHDILNDAMADNGFGTLKKLTDHRGAQAMQHAIEKDLAIEMANRQGGVKGGGIPEHISKMADKLDNLYRRALEEQQRAGVEGAQAVKTQSGYFPRKWQIAHIEQAEAKLVAEGYTAKAAHAAMVDLVAKGIRDIEYDVSKDIAHALLDRAKRKGYFDDSQFRGHIGNGGAAQMRDTLEASGLAADRVQRVLDSLTAVVDEAGKTSSLKHRIDMDLGRGINLPTGESIKIVDLIDSNMMSLTDAYLDNAAGQVGLAKKGLTTPTKIANLRSEYLGSIGTQAERNEAVTLFDDGMANILGMPTGEQVPEAMRAMQSLTQMVGLAGAGVWQITDYAKMMQVYGMGAALKNAVKEMPGFSSLFNGVKHDASEANELNRVLAANSSLDLRMKPYIQRMEDNFEVPMSHSLTIALSNAKQLVPYVNGMKYVHGHQARMAGNLIADTFSRAVKGEEQAINMLKSYGLESHMLDNIRPDIIANGLNTAKWTDATWSKVRGPLNKMMDEAVLKARTGEVPHFAQFSKLGKFLFTFRGFTLASHNKLLAGTIGKDGYAGLGMLMLYQYPLAVLATSANNTIQGKKPLTDQELALKGVSQIGALGLYGELWNTISGETLRASSPGLIAIDRMYKVAGGLRSGVKASYNDGFSVDQYGEFAGAALNSIPIVSAFGPTKAMGEHLKGK